jgi:hypothetical protein
MPYIPIVLEWQLVAGDSAISAGVTSYISSFNSTMIVPNSYNLSGHFSSMKYVTSQELQEAEAFFQRSEIVLG